MNGQLLAHSKKILTKKLGESEHFLPIQICWCRHDIKLKFAPAILFEKWWRLVMTSTWPCVFYTLETDFWWLRNSQKQLPGGFLLKLSRMFRNNEKLFGYRKTFFVYWTKLALFRCFFCRFYCLEPIEVEILCILGRTDLILEEDELWYYLSRRICICQIASFLLRRSNSQQNGVLKNFARLTGKHIKKSTF